MRKKDFSCLRYVSKRFLFQKEYLGKKFSTINFYYYMSLNIFVPEYIRQSFDNLRIFYRTDVEKKLLERDQERALRELETPLNHSWEECSQAQVHLGQVELEISKLEHRQKKLLQEHSTQLAALASSKDPHIEDRRRELQLAHERAIKEIVVSVQRHRDELIRVGGQIAQLQSQIIPQLREEIRQQKIQMRCQHAKEKEALRANEQLLYIYKKNGYEYIALENKNWGIWRRRIICILSLGILSHWAFSDLDITRIYGVAHCMLTSVITRPFVPPCNRERFVPNEGSYNSHVKMADIIEGSLLPRARKHHDKRKIVLFREIRRIKDKLNRLYPQTGGTRGYTVEDHSMHIADSIRVNWMALVDKVQQLYELRQVTSWNTTHVFSFNPKPGSIFDDGIITGYHWAFYIYYFRGLNVPVEKPPMRVYLKEINDRAEEFVGIAESVDPPSGYQYRKAIFDRTRPPL